MRKKLVAVGTAIGVAALPLVAATPAAAATTYRVMVTCPSTYTFSPSSVTAAVDDIVEIAFEPAYTVTVTTSGVSGPSTITNTLGNIAFVNYRVTSASGGSLTFTTTAGSGNCSSATETLTINPGGGGSSSDSSSGPEAAMQQFGKPDSMTCDEAQPEGLNWSGVPSGGWGESWAQWMNGGNGGTVCTRELVYRAGSWVIN